MEFLGVVRKNWCEMYLSLRFWPWNFQFQTCGTQFCRISSGESLFSLEFLKVKWQIQIFQRGGFRKVYLSTTPTFLEFFCNSPMDRWVSSKKSNYYSSMAIGTTSEKISGLSTWNFLGVYLLGKFKSSIKKRIHIAKGDEEKSWFLFLEVAWAVTQFFLGWGAKPHFAWNF